MEQKKLVYKGNVFGDHIFECDETGDVYYISDMEVQLTGLAEGLTKAQPAPLADRSKHSVCEKVQ